MNMPRFGSRPSAAAATQRADSWHKRYLWLRIALLVTAALLAFFAYRANQADAQRPHTSSTFERSGALTESDDKLGDDGRAVDIWYVQLDAGQVLRVNVQSKEFTPYFYIAGPTSPRTDSVAAGPGEAHVELSAPEAGQYSLGLQSKDPAAFGAYALSSNYRLKALWVFDDDDDDAGSASNATSVAGIFGPIFVVLLLVQLSGAPLLLLWRDPDRILLLRPFGQGPLSRAMKRFNRKHLSWHGFTFTLADKYLKHSLTAYALAHVPLDFASIATVVYRPLFRRLHRFVFITKPDDLALLRLRLRQRWRLSAFWQSRLGLSDRINKFRSSNELWQDCIDMMLDECQVIIVDLSRAGAGTTWEVEQIFERGYQYKAVFLLHDAHDEREVAAAHELVCGIAMKHAIEMPVIHRYSAADGAALDAPAFDQAYATAVSSERQPTVAALPTSTKAILAAAPTPVGLVFAILALRDIRRAKWLMRGELAAHLAIVIHAGLLLLGAAMLAVWYLKK